MGCSSIVTPHFHSECYMPAAPFPWDPRCGSLAVFKAWLEQDHQRPKWEAGKEVWDLCSLPLHCVALSDPRTSAAGSSCVECRAGLGTAASASDSHSAPPTFQHLLLDSRQQLGGRQAAGAPGRGKLPLILPSAALPSMLHSCFLQLEPPGQWGKCDGGEESRDLVPLVAVPCSPWLE